MTYPMAVAPIVLIPLNLTDNSEAADQFYVPLVYYPKPILTQSNRRAVDFKEDKGWYNSGVILHRPKETNRDKKGRGKAAIADTRNRLRFSGILRQCSFTQANKS
jgi:hypothetical protein